MSNHSSATHRVLWGILIIFIGLIFLLNNFDLFDMGDFFGTFWPIILIIVGIKIILGRKKNEDPIKNLNVSQSTIDSLSEILGSIDEKSSIFPARIIFPLQLFCTWNFQDNFIYRIFAKSKV